MSEIFQEGEREDLLSTALRVAETVKTADGYDELASAISLRYAVRGEFHRAVDIADTINDPYTQDKTLAEVAVKCAAAGQEQGAFELIDSLEDLSFQTTAAAQVALLRAGTGEFDRAEEIASEMEDNAATLAEIAHQAAAQGDYERALGLTEQLDLPLYKALALVRIADAQLQAGRTEEAKDLLARALDEAEAIDDPNERPSTLAEIALKLSEAGQGEEARAVLESAAAEALVADTKDVLLTQIAMTEAQLKEYERAVKVVEKIDDVYLAAGALAQLATIEHAHEGRQAEALQLLTDAFDLLREEEPQEQAEELRRRSTLSHIALNFAELGQPEQALKAAASIGALQEQEQALASVALTFAGAGQAEAALEAVRAIESKALRTQTRLRVSRALRAAGEMEKGPAALAEATRQLDELERPAERVQALGQAALAHSEAGQSARAMQLFRQALTETKLITDEYSKAAALIALADASAKAGFELDDDAQEMLWQLSVV